MILNSLSSQFNNIFLKLFLILVLGVYVIKPLKPKFNSFDFV